jgi:hypothetical protein
MIAKLSNKLLFIFMFVFLSLIFLVETTFAAKGKVVSKKSGCDYFIVQTNMGYALLEWYGGYDPDKGDTLAGDFESYGFKDIYDLTTDSGLRVWVEDYWLSKSHVMEEYFDKCH